MRFARIRRQSDRRSRLQFGRLRPSGQSILISTLLVATPALGNATWYVDEDARSDPGPGDATISDPLEDGSIDHPFDAIQEAIDASSDGDIVLIRSGTYRGPGNRDITFGGRAITVRGEDGAASTVIDGEGIGRGFALTSAEPRSAVLEGVTVRRGARPKPETYSGGGLLIDGASPVIRDCIFEDNAGTLFGRQGGGAAVLAGAPLFLDCRFVGNQCLGLSNTGGGLFVGGGDVTAIGCVFANNRVADGCDNDGGGIGITGGSLRLEACEVRNNTAGSGACGGSSPGTGGGIHSSGGVLFAINCVIRGNSAAGARGGGLFLAGETRLTNCTIVNNQAVFCDPGGCVGRGGGVFHVAFDAPLTIENSILSGNVIGMDSRADDRQIWSDDPAAVTLVYSCVEGLPAAFAGVGSIDANPGFVDGERPAAGSPVNDAGANFLVPVLVATDLDGAPRFTDDPDAADVGQGSAPIVDMGAYELPVVACVGDVDGSGDVGLIDLLTVISGWGDCEAGVPCTPDLNGDATVDLIDLLTVISAWGPCV